MRCYSELCFLRHTESQHQFRHHCWMFSWSPNQTGHLSTGFNCGAFFRHGLADSTQRSYTAAKRRYVQFCKLDSLPPLPTSEHLLCQYVAYLAVSGLAYSTIKSYLSAVCHLHIAENWGNPGISSMPRLEQVLRGIYASEGQ